MPANRPSRSTVGLRSGATDDSDIPENGREGEGLESVAAAGEEDKESLLGGQALQVCVYVCFCVLCVSVFY